MPNRSPGQCTVNGHKLQARAVTCDHRPLRCSTECLQACRWVVPKVRAVVQTPNMVVSRNWRSFLVGVLIGGALLFNYLGSVYWGPDFWKLPYRSSLILRTPTERTPNLKNQPDVAGFKAYGLCLTCPRTHMLQASRQPLGSKYA